LEKENIWEKKIIFSFFHLTGFPLFNIRFL
jgi:hypothetical protein